jgi:hypothetical protein
MWGDAKVAGAGGETKSPHERYDLIFLQHFYRADLSPTATLCFGYYFIANYYLCTAPIIYGDIYWRDNPLNPVT